MGWDFFLLLAIIVGLIWLVYVCIRGLARRMVSYLGNYNPNRVVVIYGRNHDDIEDEIEKATKLVQKLNKWNPKIPNFSKTKVPNIPFTSSISKVKKSKPIADVAEITSLVKTTKLFRLASFRTALNERVPEPLKSGWQIDVSPEEWEPYYENLEEPKLINVIKTRVDRTEIRLPYYNDNFPRMNKFVDEAHADEIKHFQALEREADVLEGLLNSCNENIQKANNDSQTRYKEATKKLDSKVDELKNIMAVKLQHWEKEKSSELALIDNIISDYKGKSEQGVEAYFNFVLGQMDLPICVPRTWKLSFSQDNRIMIIEHEFPELGEIKFSKTVPPKESDRSQQSQEKPATKTEVKEVSDIFYPSLCLRLAYEVFKNDPKKVIDAIAINGLVKYREKKTGQKKTSYCASLFASSSDLSKLEIDHLDPVVAFQSLKGMNASSRYEITPIAPQIRINSDDARFVEAKDILSKLSKDTNLAAMDWEAFEHLVRELFEKVWGSEGAEVNVTQASRDQGVDAIIFDPDPIKGGKIVIQAKRYTNLVEVSAVRDLFGTVLNEGANKGILVTTSNFGPDSYEFVKGKPLTLIEGSELLSLLGTQGYDYKIDLKEAKELLKEQN